MNRYILQIAGIVAVSGGIAIYGAAERRDRGVIQRELVATESELASLLKTQADLDAVDQLRVDRERLRGIVAPADELAAQVRQLESVVAPRETELKAAQAALDEWMNTYSPSKTPILSMLTLYRCLGTFRSSVRTEYRAINDRISTAVEQRRAVEPQARQLEGLSRRLREIELCPETERSGQDLTDLRKELAELDRRIAAVEPIGPAQMRDLRQRIAVLTEKVARLRAELAALDRPPPPTDPPQRSDTGIPPGQAEVTTEIVEVDGYGRPEGIEEIEQCTWQFKIRVTLQNHIPVKLGLAERRREPAEIQKAALARAIEFDLPVTQQPVAIGPTVAVLPGAPVATIDIGPEYLAVRRADQYSGTYAAVLAGRDANGNSVRFPITWRSPGRPPVGPPQTRSTGTLEVTVPSDPVIDVTPEISHEVVPGSILQHLEFSESGGECVREWYELKGETRGPVQSFYDRARTRLYKDGYSAEKGWSYDIYFDPAGRKKYESYGYTPGGLPSKDCKYFKDTEVRREEVVLLPTEPGKRFGRWTEWYPNGQKKSETFERQRGQDRDWASDGWRLARSWQEDGALASEEYVGPGEARITACYANGRTMMQVHVRYTDATNSTPAAARKLEWYENGRLRNEESHRNGRMVERTEWNEDGTVKAHSSSP